ncbi:unnamed protein product [Caenorhabditis brenneri]
MESGGATGNEATDPYSVIPQQFGTGGQSPPQHPVAGRQHAFDANDFKLAGRMRQKINMRVIDFNFDYPKDLDLHYMTEKGAVTFMAIMCSGNHGIWKMEDPLGTEPRIHILLFRNNSEMVDNGWY